MHTLINLYRVRGHLIANLDPLGLKEPKTHPELDPVHHGLTIWDLEREFPCAGIGGRRTMRLRDVLRVLRDAYSRTIGLEYMHIQDPAEKEWIQDRVEREQPPLRTRAQAPHPRAPERGRGVRDVPPHEVRRPQALRTRGRRERDRDARRAARPRRGVRRRGGGVRHGAPRPAERPREHDRQVLRADLPRVRGQLHPDAPQGSGTKYHLGAEGHKAPGDRSVRLTLASNPSHLEAVDPVVVGMARARQDRMGDVDHARVLPILIHGDAAFAGQGVVAETLNLSELPGYEVGGTIHLVVNNQLGFTTPPELGRSCVYPTDVAKIVQAPIFHVNGDDPEACVRVVELAFEFRQKFNKDVVVDLVCYRRHGHNETDEPSFTQPRMYAHIAATRSVRKLYTETLVNRGDITVEEAEQVLADFRRRLDATFGELDEAGRGSRPRAASRRRAGARSRTTAVPRETLARVIDTITRAPEGFAVHPKLERQLAARRRSSRTATSTGPPPSRSRSVPVKKRTVGRRPASAAVSPCAPALAEVTAPSTGEPYGSDGRVGSGTLTAAEGTLDAHLRFGPQMLQYEALADDLARRGPGRVLDWGCGYGQVTSLLRDRGVDVVAFDYRDEDLAQPTVERLERYPEIEAHLSPDPVVLPFSDDSFDTVLSCGVLEHVAAPGASLDQIRRVLKPHGTFYVTNLPNRYSYTEKIARLLGHYYHGQLPDDRVVHEAFSVRVLPAPRFRRAGVPAGCTWSR